MTALLQSSRGRYEPLIGGIRVTPKVVSCRLFNDGLTLTQPFYYSIVTAISSHSQLSLSYVAIRKMTPTPFPRRTIKGWNKCSAQRKHKVNSLPKIAALYNYLLLIRKCHPILDQLVTVLYDNFVILFSGF